MNFKTIFTAATISVSVFAHTTSQADDLEVFKSISGGKPNILFVFDRSGSMERNIAGNTTSIEATKRGTILKTAFEAVLTENADTINAGLGPFYRGLSTGVKWPISDLAANAHEIDPSIPQAAGLTVADAINEIYNLTNNNQATNIVDALYESALYFRGDPPRVGTDSGVDRFRPDQWQSGAFVAGSELAPYPATYTPSDAYDPEGIEHPDIPGTCVDNSSSGGFNNCNNADFISVTNCSVIPPQPTTMCTEYDTSTATAAIPGTTGTPCTGGTPSTCTAYNSDGICISSTAGTPCTGGTSGTSGTPAYPGVCLTEVPGTPIPSYTRCDTLTDGGYSPDWLGADYNTPIAQQCQATFILLLSDGDPTARLIGSEAETMTGVSPCENLGLTTFSGALPSERNHGDCGIELVEYMANEDQIPTIPGSTITTYTIGFANAGPGQGYLEQLATAGGGEFFPANDAAELNAAFADIIKKITGPSESFTSVSVDVDRASFSSDDRAYFALFQPGGGRNWRGNLKGYFVDADGLKDVHGVPATVITPEGPEFSETSQSFWSAQPDGDGVPKGGASSRIDATSRTLLTYTGGTLPSFGANLLQASNSLHTSNTNITSAMLAGADRSALEWIYEAPMADPLHTKPVKVRYQNDTVIYVMTNQGLLHAFDGSQPNSVGDTTGGTEMWAFMPQELLKNLGDLQVNLPNTEHIYGLDGGMTVWLDESTQRDGVITAGEEAVLYIGMRRGGDNYYAIDVSNPNSPRLKWKISGGTGQYERLGQSWSRMALTTMKKPNGSNTKVLVFSGGYDEDLDGEVARTASDDSGNPILGNDIFVVDADNGNLLWSLSNYNNTLANFAYAIPSDINIIDSDADGLADRFYFGDMGGQLWRIDFEDGRLQNNKASVHMLADFGGAGEHHAFFYPPSVAIIRENNDYHVAVSIGSGTRDHPLNMSTSNAVFMVRDVNTEAGPPVLTADWPFTVSDLFDATDNSAGSSDPAVALAAQALLQQADGWVVYFNTAEKALAKTTIFQNELLFTTFTPLSTPSATNVCENAETIGKFYRMDIKNATPVEHLSGGDPTAPLTTADRSSDINSHGIPGSAEIVFPQNSETAQVYVGQQQVGEVVEELTRLLWYSE